MDWDYRPLQLHWDRSFRILAVANPKIVLKYFYPYPTEARLHIILALSLPLSLSHTHTHTHIDVTIGKLFASAFVSIDTSTKPISEAARSEAWVSGAGLLLGLRVRIPLSPCACPSVSFECFVCCQVDVFASGRSPVQRPLPNMVCLNVISNPQRLTDLGRRWPSSHETIHTCNNSKAQNLHN